MLLSDEKLVELVRSHDGGQGPWSNDTVSSTLNPGSLTSQTGSIERTGISGATAPLSVSRDAIPHLIARHRRATASSVGRGRRVTRLAHGSGLAFETEPKTFGL
jgi:hypothetical protein